MDVSMNTIYSICRDSLLYAYNDTVMSSILQIQIAQVAAIITLLSISMAASKDKIFGLQIKDLLSIGGDSKFRFFSIYMLLQLALLLVNAFCLLFMKRTIILLFFFVSIIASTVISCIYVPVITINEKRAIRIIRKAVSSDKSKVNKDKIMNALWEIASQLGYKQSIEELTYGLPDDKQKIVVNLLLDKVTERIRNINQLTSTNDISVIQDYTEGLLYIDEKLIKEEPSRIIGIVALSIFNIGKDGRSNVIADATNGSGITSVVNRLIKYLDYQNNVERAHIMMSVICRIIKYSVEDSSTNIPRICRDEFAQFWGFYGDERNSLKQMTFFEVSRYYYYILCLDDSIHQQVRTTARAFLNDDEVLNPHQRTMSWKTMLQSQIEEMPIDINEYADAYLEKNDWEYPVFNIVRNVILNEASLFDWWIKCRILSRQGVCDLEASQICDKYKTHMINALSQYCDNSTKRYDTSKSVKELAQLLEIEWNTDEDAERHLFALKNKLASETMICKTSMDDTVLASLDSRIMMVLTGLTQKTCLTVEKSDLPQHDATLFTMNLWQELPTDRDNYLASAENHIAQIIYDYLCEHIHSLIDNSQIRIIKPNDTTGTQLLDILNKINPMYYTEPISRGLLNMPAYIGIANGIEKLEQQSKCIGTKTAGHGMFIGENALSIEWEIKKIESRRLSHEEIEEKVRSYLREDGSYYYYGVYGDYQQAYDYVKENHIITITQYYLDLKVDCDNCVIVDIWGYIERRRKNRTK